MALPAVYTIYKCGGDVVTYLLTLIFFSIIGLVVQLDAVNRLIESFKIKSYINLVIVPSLLAYVIPLILSLYFSQMRLNLLQAVGVILLVLLICIVSVCFVGLTKYERIWIVNIVKAKLNKSNG